MVGQQTTNTLLPNIDVALEQAGSGKNCILSASVWLERDTTR